MALAGTGWGLMPWNCSCVCGSHDVATGFFNLNRVGISFDILQELQVGCFKGKKVASCSCVSDGCGRAWLGCIVGLLCGRT